MARNVLPPERAFPVTAGAPHVRGFWNCDRIFIAVILALLPPLGMAIHDVGPAFLTGMAAAVVAAIAWQAAFAYWRHQSLTGSGVVAAMVVVILLPPALPLWQLMVGVSFGIVVGEQIFGGYGRNFVSPATLTLAFLIFSFPDSGFDKGGMIGWAACVPGGVLLLAAGILNWRVVVAALVGSLALALASGGTPVDQLFGGAFVFGLIFLAGDPVPAPATNLGRWLYGFAIGALSTVGGAGGGGTVRDVVFACLIGSIFAPLIDQFAIWVNVWKRRWRHGKT